MTFDNKVSSFYLLDDDLVFKANRTKEEKDLEGKGLKDTNLYSLSLDEGETKKLFSLPLDIGKIERLDGDTYIFTGTYNRKKQVFTTSRTLKARKEMRKFLNLQRL